MSGWFATIDTLGVVKSQLPDLSVRFPTIDTLGWVETLDTIAWPKSVDMSAWFGTVDASVFHDMAERVAAEAPEIVADLRGALLDDEDEAVAFIEPTRDQKVLVTLCALGALAFLSTLRLAHPEVGEMYDSSLADALMLYGAYVLWKRR